VAHHRWPGRPGPGFDDHRSVCGLRRWPRRRPQPTAASDPHPRAVTGRCCSGTRSLLRIGGRSNRDGGRRRRILRRPHDGAGPAGLRRDSAPDRTVPLRMTITLISNFNN